MIRRSLILWVALAAMVSVALFVVKYEVKTLEEEFARLNREIQRNRDAIHVLRAEWSSLNRPDQLAEMALRHLDLRPLLTGQMGEVKDLPARKPEAAPDMAAAPDAEAPKTATVAKPVKPAPQPKPTAVPVSARPAP